MPARAFRWQSVPYREEAAPCRARRLALGLPSADGPAPEARRREGLLQLPQRGCHGREYALQPAAGRAFAQVRSDGIFLSLREQPFEVTGE
jgi:hypothetical protein